MAKRVNTKFLIGLTATVGGLAVLAFGMAIYYSRHHHNAAYYINRAAADESRQDWEAAAGDISNAIVRQRSNTALYVQLAGYFERMTAKDPVYLGKANQMYRQALEVDPASTPAIDHLLAAYVTEMKLGVNNPSFFNELKNIADKGQKADSNNSHYEVYFHIAALQSNPNELTELKNLANKHPEESDAAFYASEAQFKRARDLWNSGQAELANNALDEIAGRHDAATKARPKDPAVQLRAAQIFGQLAMGDPRPDHRDGWQKQADLALHTAYASAKPTDDVFDDVQSAYVALLRTRKASSKEIEQALTAWTTARPHDERARLELAGYLATLEKGKRRPDAVKLVEAPVPPDPDLRGYAALDARRWERARLIALNTFRVEDASAAKGKEREALLSPVDSDLAKIASMGLGEDASLLKLRGKVQMLRGNPVEAIKSFERAQTLLGNTIDLDLWAQLRHAYEITQQTGTEQRLMEDLLNRVPGAVPIRIQLADLYLRTRQTDKASQQVNVLNSPEQLKIIDSMKGSYPDLPADIQRLKVEVLARQNQSDAAQDQFTTLPETTREDRLIKAQIAADVDVNNESSERMRRESERLYRLVLHDNPADPKAVVGAINLFLREKNLPEAQQVVNDAIKAEPDNSNWKMLRDQLAANTPESIRKLQQDYIDQAADPLLRALRSAQLAMEQGHLDQADEQLKAAEKIKADDARVLTGRIQWYVSQRRFNEAAPVVDRAAAANADQMDGLQLRTRFALTRNDAAGAMKYGTELVGKHGEFALNWLLLARAQQMAGQFDEAVASCDAAIQRQANNLEALKIMAACLESLAQYSQEKDVIAQAQGLAPEDVAVRDLSLNYELHHGDADGVIARCEQILRKEPENPAIYSALGQACEMTAQTKYRGDAANSRRLFERARDVLAQGMSKFPNTADAYRFYSPLAAALDGLGDRAGAEDLLKQYAARPDQQQLPEASHELALFYERHGRAQDAENAWRDAYARSGHSVPLELEYCQFFIRQGRHDQALKVLAEAPPLNSTDPRVQNQKIETLMALARIDDALKQVNDVYGADSTAPAALYYRGLISLRRGAPKDAERSLTAARDKEPGNAMVRIWLARALLAQNRRDDAAAELVDVLHRNPLRDDARMLLLDAYSSDVNPRWQDFDEVVTEAENNPALASDPAWHQIHARGLVQRGQFAQAKVQLDAARKLAPDSFILWDEYVNLLVRAKDWQHVLEETDKQIAAGHKKPSVYGKRGIARGSMGDKAGSGREFDAALSANPAPNPNQIADLLQSIAQTLGPDEALARVGTCPRPGRDILIIQLLGLKGDHTAQISAADSALELGDRLSAEQKVVVLRAQIDAYLTVSKADKTNPKWDKARRAMDQLLVIRPDDVITLNNAAYLMCQILNDPQSARPYSTRAFKITSGPDQAPEIIDTHGWILTLCGGPDAPQGLGILKDLVDSHPGFTKAQYHLVEAYIRSGRFEQALDHLKIVQSQIKQMQDNHVEVDGELLAGAAKAAEEIRQKSGRAAR
jgi:predicted Zn-dependent protease